MNPSPDAISGRISAARAGIGAPGMAAGRIAMGTGTAWSTARVNALAGTRNGTQESPKTVIPFGADGAEGNNKTSGPGQ